MTKCSFILLDAKRFNVTGTRQAAQTGEAIDGGQLFFEASPPLSTTTNKQYKKESNKKATRMVSKFPSFFRLDLPKDTVVLDRFLCTVISWDNQTGEEVDRDNRKDSNQEQVQ